MTAEPDDATKALTDASRADHTEPTSVPEPGAHELPRGTSVGRYIVLDHLGSGGMGVVYAAYDPELDRRVALKLLRPQGKRVSRARSRLIREAQAMAKLSHPNVLPVYDVGEVDDQVFVAIEFIDGETLGTWLHAGPHEVANVLSHFIAAGRGLAAAHAEGLVHRDFKPHNVLLGRRGEVRVMDFGLARPAVESHSVSADPEESSSRSHDEPDLTETGMVMGTPAYMAPEQHMSSSVDHRADQFSFCVALYEALYGVRPFGGRTSKQIHAAAAKGQPASPMFDKGVPSWLRKAVVRGLSLNPADRWPDMPTLLAILERAQGRRKSRALIGLGVVAVGTTAGILSFVAAPPVKCEGMGEAMEATWNAEVAAKLEGGFVATELGYAADAWNRTETILADYAAQWTAVRQDACEATHVRGVQSGQLLDRRIACLDGRKRYFDALLDVFAEPTPATVERALKAAQGLPSLTRCSDTAALDADVAPPEDPATQAEVDRLRSELAHLRALSAASRIDEALARVEALVAEAEATDYPPVVAETKQRYAIALSESGAYDRAEPPAREALVIAEELGMDRLAAQIYTFLTRLVGTRLARYDEGLQLGELALAKLRRSRAGGRAEAQLFSWLTELTDRKGDFAASKANAQRSMRAWEESAPDAPEYAASIGNLGRVAFRERDFEAALARFQRGHEILLGIYGARHPEVAKALSNIGACYHSLKRYEQTRAVLLEAAEIMEASLGPEHPDLAVTLTNLSNAYLRLEEYEEARAVAYRGYTIKVSAYGPENPTVGYSANNLGLINLKLERHEEALRYYAEAYDILHAALGTEHPGVFEPLIGKAEVLQALGRHAESLPLLHQARDLAVKHDLSEERHQEVATLLDRAEP